MNQQELNALLVEVDMPRAVTAELRENEVKLRVDFANPTDPIKIAEAYGSRLEIGSGIDQQVAAYATAARDLIADKRPGLVPYDSIASNQVPA